MRILFVSDTYYPHINGVYYFVCRIGPLLQEKGHEVQVIAPSDSIHYHKKKVDGLEVHYVPSLPVITYPTLRLPIQLFLRLRIKNLIQNFKPDIIHIQDHMVISKVVVRLNRKLKLPIIGTNHFMPENLSFLVPQGKARAIADSILWKDFSRVYNQLNLVTTPSEFGANLIRPLLKVETIAISSGLNPDGYNPSGNSDAIREKYNIPDKPILLYAGRLDPEKHIDEIVHAVSLAIKKTDFCFVLVGKGMKKNALEQLADNLGIREKVVFTGFVPDEDLPYLYKLSRCFIIASIAELLSLVTLQAMASGLPVIAVNAGALRELVRDNVNGFLFETGDIKTMSHCIEEIMANVELSRQMGEKSLEFVQDHDIRKACDSFEKLYEVQINKSKI
jgi:1,2-diacylglycerol 3-alpha-glucosyltransferase